MQLDVVLAQGINEIATSHLLAHVEDGKRQEDLCFGLWSPSSGAHRQTAVLHEVVLPNEGDRLLHGGASFQPAYLTRSLLRALSKNCGLAFMHSHLSDGWQGMSDEDVIAEGDVLAHPAGATKLPLVGLTVGTDGYWSARFWTKDHGVRRHWCSKVRVVGKDKCSVYFNSHIAPPPVRKNILRRTYDTWGTEAQGILSRLHVGIVGLGSVGSVVSEALARIGVPRVTLVDPDVVEEHNLDRLLHGTPKDVGRSKVDLAEKAFRAHATTDHPQVQAINKSIHAMDAYRAILDCDFVFSCVDRPVARDVLNYVSQSHLIPVIDGGIAVGVHPTKYHLSSAHWRAHMSTPLHACLRCLDQYNTSMVVMELDGSLDDPSYTQGLAENLEERNENVFPFSLSLSGMMINLFLRYLLSEPWWPRPVARQQEYQFVINSLETTGPSGCEEHCVFRTMRAKGDASAPPYLVDDVEPARQRVSQDGVRFFSRLVTYFGSLFRRG